MPRPGPRRQQIAVRMSAEQIAALDHLAVWLDVERSEVVRRAVDAYVEAWPQTTKRPPSPKAERAFWRAVDGEPTPA